MRLSSYSVLRFCIVFAAFCLGSGAGTLAEERQGPTLEVKNLSISPQDGKLYATIVNTGRETLNISKSKILQPYCNFRWMLRKAPPDAQSGQIVPLQFSTMSLAVNAAINAVSGKVDFSGETVSLASQADIQIVVDLKKIAEPSKIKEFFQGANQADLIDKINEAPLTCSIMINAASGDKSNAKDVSFILSKPLRIGKVSEFFGDIASILRAESGK